MSRLITHYPTTVADKYSPVWTEPNSSKSFNHDYYKNTKKMRQHTEDDREHK